MQQKHEPIHYLFGTFKLIPFYDTLYLDEPNALWLLFKPFRHSTSGYASQLLQLPRLPKDSCLGVHTRTSMPEERVQFYATQLPQEAARIGVARPPRGWPSQGRLEVQDLKAPIAKRRWWVEVR